MDRSAVKAIVDREIEPLMRRLGIPHWHVKVGYEPIPTEEGPPGFDYSTRARVAIDLEYNRASIQMDPGAFDDESEVLADLRHELLHIVLSPYDQFRDIAWAAGGKGRMKRVLRLAWTHAIEKAVINLNRMYLGLTNPDLDPAKERPLKKAPMTGKKSAAPAKGGFPVKGSSDPKMTKGAKKAKKK